MRTDSTRVAESAAAAGARLPAHAVRRGVSRQRGCSSTATAKAQEHAGRARERFVRPIRRAGRTTSKRYLTPDQFKLYQLDLAALHGVADGAGGLRHDHGRLRHPVGEAAATSAVAAICSAPRAAIVKFQGFLVLYREGARGGRAPRRSRTSRRCRSSKSARSVPCKGDHAEPALHRAAAALLRGEPRQGARAARHRPSVDVRVDHLRARRPALRRARAAPLLPDRARRERREGDGQAVPRHLQRRTSRRRWKRSSTRSKRATLGWQKVLKDFYSPFAARLEQGGRAVADRRSVRPVGARTSCAVRTAAASSSRAADSSGRSSPARIIRRRASTRVRSRARRPSRVLTEHKCHVCGAPMVIRHGPQRAVPRLQHVPEVSRHALDADGRVLSRRTAASWWSVARKKRGTAFYACSNEDCDFVAWNKPVAREVSGVRLRRRRDEVQQDARRFPEVPQVRQRVGRAESGRTGGRGAGARRLTARSDQCGRGRPPLTRTGVASATPFPSPSSPCAPSPQQNT